MSMMDQMEAALLKHRQAQQQSPGIDMGEAETMLKDVRNPYEGDPRFRPVVDPSVGEFGDNIPESGARNVHDVMSAFKQPDEIIKGMYGLIADPDTRAAFGKYMNESYGSWDNIKRAAYNDPIGVASELSVVGLPLKYTGRAARKVGAAGMGPGANAAARAGAFTENLGAAIEHMDPIMAGTTALKFGGAHGAGMALDPERVYRQGLKMPTTGRFADIDTRNAVSRNLLEDDIPITQSGLNRKTDIIDDKVDRLNALVAKADADGTTIPVNDVLSWAYDLRKQRSNPATNIYAAEDAAAIDKLVKNWVEGMNYRMELKPSEVRELRQNLDRNINHNRSPAAVAPPITAMAEESMANGARQALAEAVGTDSHGTTARAIGQDITAHEALQRAVNRQDNNNRQSLRGSGQANAGAIITALGLSQESPLATALGALMAGSGILLNVETKQALARMIYRNKNLPNAAKNTLLRQLITTPAEAQTMLEGGEELLTNEGQ